MLHGGRKRLLYLLFLLFDAGAVAFVTLRQLNKQCPLFDGGARASCSRPWRPGVFNAGNARAAASSRPGKATVVPPSSRAAAATATATDTESRPSEQERPAATVRIRVASRDDLNQVATIQMREYGQGILFALCWLQELDRLQTSLSYDPPRHTMLVAEEAERRHPLVGYLLNRASKPKIVGFVDLDCRPARVDRTTPAPYLSDLIVVSEKRGQGIGRRLMLQCEPIAMGWGFQSMYLKVRNTNGGALRLYEELGYVVVKETADGIITMRKFLGNPAEDLGPWTEADWEGEGRVVGPPKPGVTGGEGLERLRESTEGTSHCSIAESAPHPA